MRRYTAWKEYWDVKGNVAKRRYLAECKRRGVRPLSPIEFEHFKAECLKRGVTDWMAHLDLRLTYAENVDLIRKRYPLPTDVEEVDKEYEKYLQDEMEEAWREYERSEEATRYYLYEAPPEERERWFRERIKEYEEELEEAYRTIEEYKARLERLRHLEEERKKIEEEKKRIEEERKRIPPEEIERMRIMLDYLSKSLSELHHYVREMDKDVRAALARPAVPAPPTAVPPEVSEAKSAYLAGQRERAREILRGAGYTEYDVRQWFRLWEAEREEEEWKGELRIARCFKCGRSFSLPYWVYMEFQKKAIGHPSLRYVVECCEECRKKYYSAHVAGAITQGVYTWDQAFELGFTRRDLRYWLKREWDRGLE